MMDRIKKLWPWISLVLLLAFTLLIFSFSLDTAEESSEKSEKVTEALQAICDALNMDVEVVEGAVRKAAHFAEFALLGALAFLCSRAFDIGICPALLYSIIAAATDETIQIYSSERSSSTTDVLLDFAGSVLGVLCLLLIIKLRKPRKPENKK